MRIKRRKGEPEDYTNPAAESIDEALARLARQDKRLNPEDPPTLQPRAVRPGRATRDWVWSGLRWVIILGVVVVIWRATQR